MERLSNQHVHVVKLLGAGRDRNGVTLFAMEVGAGDLHDFVSSTVKKRCVPWQEVEFVAEQLHTFCAVIAGWVKLEAQESGCCNWHTRLVFVMVPVWLIGMVRCAAAEASNPTTTHSPLFRSEAREHPSGAA